MATVAEVTKPSLHSAPMTWRSFIAQAQATKADAEASAKVLAGMRKRGALIIELADGSTSEMSHVPLPTWM